MRKYTTITTLNLSNCRINAYGIMQIAQMLTEIGCLRDINLDMNPNVQENYDLLCTSSGNLSYLSLRLCHITDNGIRKIANELKYQDPPRVPKLIALNLAHNKITKIGAKYIASMLRTNRSLQSLVLTANNVDDEGAMAIINELNMSILTHSEITDLRRRRYAELSQQGEKLKGNTVLQNSDKIVDENQSQKSNKSSKRQSSSQASRKLSRQISSSKTNEGGQNLYTRVHSIQKRGTIGGIGDDHPFRTESIHLKGSVVASGNFQIQHLNISFNRLTNKILTVLIGCLYYQNYMMLEDTTRGLLHVFLEGNEIRKENNEDWTMVLGLLESRRQIKPSYNTEGYAQLLPTESKILRKNMKTRGSR
ncbi:hypothetical protein KM043_008709 [Ampulex compressa]|nr:hypothetical protein KM043_008709 [Ampulex compressa]